MYITQFLSNGKVCEKLLSILKIEAKTEISPFFLNIYQKNSFENLYWYIRYTINKYFLYGGVTLLIF